MTRREEIHPAGTEGGPVVEQADFEEAMARHLPWVVDLASSILRDPGVAEDIAQRAFIKLWEGVSEGKVRNDCCAWLRRVALNLRRKHIRDEGRNDVRLEEALRARESESPSCRPGIGSAEWRLMLEKAAELPPQQRLAFTLVSIEGLSYQEAAEIMSCKPDTVKCHHKRARSKLREHFARLGENVRTKTRDDS